MSDDLLGQLGKMAGGAVAVIGGLLWGVNKLKLSTATDSSTVDLIKTLREERDSANTRADAAEASRDEARRSLAEIKEKMVTLEATVQEMREQLEERNDHIELMILVVEHLIMNKPLPEEVRSKFAMFQLLGKNYHAEPPAAG